MDLDDTYRYRLGLPVEKGVDVAVVKGVTLVWRLESSSTNVIVLQESEAIVNNRPNVTLFNKPTYNFS